MTKDVIFANVHYSKAETQLIFVAFKEKKRKEHAVYPNIRERELALKNVIRDILIRNIGIYVLNVLKKIGKKY